MSHGSHSRFHRVPAMTASPAAQTEDRTEALWARYRSAGDAEARAQLLVRHLGLVHHVAREVSRRIPSVELGELVTAGALGLMKALDSFDLSRGLAFSTYAVLRIRGAILDDLRSRDSTPRSVRVKRRRIESADSALERPLGQGEAAENRIRCWCSGSPARSRSNSARSGRSARDRPCHLLEMEGRGGKL